MSKWTSNLSPQGMMAPTQPDTFGYLYALLVAAGGVVGYAKAGSMPSLAMGLLFGGLLGAGSYMVSQDRRNVLLSTVASGALTGAMGYRFYQTRSVMPAAVIAGLSLWMFIRYGRQYLGR